MRVYTNRFCNIISGVHYVYVYFDPTIKEPFYVGKGKNERAYFHLKEKFQSGKRLNYQKLNKIKEIRESGETPIVQFPLRGKSEQECYDVEQWLIKTIGTIKKKTGPLTNLVTEGFQRKYDTEDAKNAYKKISNSRKEGIKSGRIKNPMQGINNKGENNPRYGDHRNFEQLHGVEKANELKKKYSELRSGSKNPRSKSWIFIDPDGNIFNVDGECKKFCEENDLSMRALKLNLGQKVHYKFLQKMRKSKTEGWILHENNESK